MTVRETISRRCIRGTASGESFRVVNAAKSILASAFVFAEAEARVKSEVLDHSLIGVEPDFKETFLPGMGLREVEEGASDACALAVRVDRDVFDEQVTRSFSQDDYPDYRANVGDEDLSLLRLLIVVIVHGSWPSAHSRDVYGVCALDEIAHELDIGGVCSANHGSSGTMQETFKAKARRDSTATPSARGKRCQRPAERARGQASHLGPRWRASTSGSPVRMDGMVGVGLWRRSGQWSRSTLTRP